VRVQLLETNLAARDALLALLRSAGHDVDLPLDFGAAAHFCGDDRFDVILIDINHPVLEQSGFENWVRSSGRSALVAALVPAISDCLPVLTASGFDDVIPLDAGEAFISLRLGMLAQRIAQNHARSAEALEKRVRELPVRETSVLRQGDRDAATSDEFAPLAVHATKVSRRSPNGEVSGFSSPLHDVSEIFEAQSQASSSEVRFRKLIEHSSDVLLVVDRDACIRWMAPSVERTLGRAAHGRLGCSVFDFIVTEDLENAHAIHATTLTNPGMAQSVLVRVKAADGSVRSILNTVTNLLGTDVDGIVLNGRDVTETVEAQDLLRREKEYVRVALDSAGMAAWQYDLVRDRVLLTPEAAAAFGLPSVAAERALSDLSAFIHPDDRHLFTGVNLAGNIETNSVDIEFRAVWPDGTMHWLEAKGQPSFDAAGAPVLFAGVLFEVTTRKTIEATRHGERAILENLMNQGPDAIFIKDRESRFTRVNQLVARHFGFEDSADMTGKTDFDLFPADEAERYFTDEQRVMNTGVPVLNRLDCHPRGAGGDTWVLTSLAPIRDEHFVVVGVIGTSRDVTHYRLDDRQLAIAEMRYRLVVEQIPAITCLYSIKDGEQSYEYLSPQVERILGYTPQEYAELWVNEPESMFHPDDRERMNGTVERVNSAHAAATLEYRHRVKGGGWKWIKEIASPIPGEDFNHRRWQGMMFDLTEDRALTERLEHQVFHDPLTGLPNRLMLSQRLDLVVAQSERSKRGFALLFIDLDDFKRVNDSKGHHLGDAALIAVAERLRELTRAGDTVARLGGDEFVLLIADISSPRDAHEIAERVQRSFKQTFDVSGGPITLSPSIGVSVYDRARSVPGEMLREADAAMYEAKRAGRGRTRMFCLEPRFPALANPA